MLGKLKFFLESILINKGGIINEKTLAHCGAGADSKPPVKEPDKKPVKKPAKESSTSDSISSDASITVVVNSPAVATNEPKQATTNRASSRKPA